MFRAGTVLFIGTLIIASTVSSLSSAENAEIRLLPLTSAVVLTLNLTESEWVEFSWLANGSVIFLIQDIEGNSLLDQLGQVGSGIFVAPEGSRYLFEFDNPRNLNVTLEWTIRRVESSFLATFYDIDFLLVLALLILVTLYVAVSARKRGGSSETT